MQIFAISSFNFILQHWDCKHPLHSPMENCNKYYKERLKRVWILPSYNWTKMMSTQSVAPIFLSASIATICPHQQSPIKWPLSLIKKKEMQAYMPMKLRRKYKYTATNKQDSLEWERLWLLHNGLPIRTELVKRKITVNSGCLTCEEGEAALEHLFTNVHLQAHCGLLHPWISERTPFHLYINGWR